MPLEARSYFLPILAELTGVSLGLSGGEAKGDYLTWSIYQLASFI